MNRGSISLLFCALAALSCKPGYDSLWLNAEVPQEECPAYEYRILDHWDNLDDSVERGYAGASIWEWTSDRLPSERIRKYGELNRKIGINGIVLNNVNASAAILDSLHLQRVKGIADILRESGIRVFLSVNFSSPSILGALPVSDPLLPSTREWWKSKIAEIYSLVPDFGGFLVKASSEGQPGPQDFGRSHADGANMFADALAPYGGIVMWRTFVYSPDDSDRAGQAYREFFPLDGKFRDNVVLQIKNGPIDFQPREPFSPLFGALRHTAMAPEFQITQEYTGQSRNLVFLAPIWEECLKSDTYRDGPGSTVALATLGRSPSVIAGVSNVGRDPDWCGSIFAQANWYAFGRLASNPSLTSEKIADEWLHLSFPKPLFMSKKRFESEFISVVKDMMLSSREACVDYMMPLGLHHLFAADHHYGPDPGYVNEDMRPDWLPSYYHRAGKDGIGFDRSINGSGTVLQYNEPLASLYGNPDTCPQEYLLWFHHLPWDRLMPDGNTLWEELCAHYDRGVRKVEEYVEAWKGLKPYVDKKRYKETASLLEVQLQDAIKWRDTCLEYFSGFSGLPVPKD